MAYDSEQSKRWYRNNKEKRDAWRLKNKEKLKAQAKANRDKNKEKRIAQYALDKEKHREYARKRRRTTMYDMAPGEYEERVAEQKGCCAICRKPVEKLRIDHCHKTKEVRGLLCHHCNVALGHLKDDIQILRNAIEYLEIYDGPSEHM